ncbi:right-handed parallel beta-helix repeat-containing protein [Nitrospira sp. T9]|uniref:right-handed parallel beta-helix repeat-containing protein n=1 Tax=unclassified Nitrospira TaxID=2652172 RepID=UPI003F9CD8F1
MANSTFPKPQASILFFVSGSLIVLILNLSLSHAGGFILSAHDETSLRESLARAKAGDTIELSGSGFNVTGEIPMKIPEGVTIQGERTAERKYGPSIWWPADADRVTPPCGSSGTSFGTRCLFMTAGDNVQIIGITLIGGHFVGYKWAKMRAGIYTNHNGLKVTGSKIWGFSHYGVAVDRAKNVEIIGNFFTENRAQGYGYGVAIDRGEVLFEKNDFNACRHGISGTGREGTKFIARYNNFFSFGHGGRDNPDQSYPIDMHGVYRKDLGRTIAGSKMIVHRNSFREVYPAGKAASFTIEGIPLELSEFTENTFFKAPRMIQFKEEGGGGGFYEPPKNFIIR